MDDKISIVTVNYNNGVGLKATIESVVQQTYKNIEFIIVDGGSIDSSLDVIDEYKDRIDIVISEKDSGVYDAMNKGISKSTGKWLNFMNSGDVFHSDSTISNVFNSNIPLRARLIYGSQFKSKGVTPPFPTKFLEYGVIHACHQAMFFYNEGLHYNKSFSIYADYDLVLRIYALNPDSLFYVNEVICEFEGGGISSIATKEKRIDKYKSVYKIYGVRGVIRSFLYMLASKI